MRYLLAGLALTTLSGCSSIQYENNYQYLQYKLTEMHCQTFEKEQFGKCMRRAYPRADLDKQYIWEQGGTLQWRDFQ